MRSHLSIPDLREYTIDFLFMNYAPVLMSSRVFPSFFSIKFLGKWMDLENIILSEVTQTQKMNHGMHSLISGY